MIKIFQTGDNHFGIKYNRYADSDVKNRLIESRYEALENCIHIAEEEGCEFFVVTGDLFDTVGVAQKVIKRAVEILGEFSGTVLVLPGNHDFYTEETSVWQHFLQLSASKEIVLLNKFEPYKFESNSGETLVVYPAFCQSKHSNENNLDWIRQQGVSTDVDFSIGVAHGALKGITPDIKQEYFLMTEDELKALNMDAWLIGHTHVPYPNLSKVDKDARETGSIYNAGTHQQTDLANGTEGWGFIVTLSREGDNRRTCARAVRTGLLRFADIELFVNPVEGKDLSKLVASQLADFDPANTIVRLKINGSLSREDYGEWRGVCDEVLSAYLYKEYDASGLSEELTMERVKDEFSDMSMAYKILEKLLEPREGSVDLKEAHMAYELLQECKDVSGRR